MIKYAAYDSLCFIYLMKLLLQLSLIILSATTSVSAQDRITVKTANIADVASYPERSAPATVISLNVSTISARIAAQVDELPIRVGDIVEKDSVLAKLDCSDYKLASSESKARLDGLKAQIELAKRRLERTKKLTLKRSVSEEILDERESDLAVLNTDYRAAMSKVKMAKLNASRCVVTSPFCALINERSSAIGQYANTGTALVKIMDIEQLEISAQVFNRDSEQISLSEKLFFEHADIRYPVSLRTVIPAINPETRNREVRLLFINDPALPGSAGKLIWRDKRAHIPGEYLLRRNNELGVFTIENDIARFIPVPSAETGRASPTSLATETPIVIEGHFSLKEGDAVTVAN